MFFLLDVDFFFFWAVHELLRPDCFNMQNCFFFPHVFFLCWGLCPVKSSNTLLELLLFIPFFHFSDTCMYDLQIALMFYCLPLRE